MRKAKFTVLGLSIGMALAIGMVTLPSPLVIQQASAEEAVPVFTPPVSGAPTRRVGGGSRGMAEGEALPSLAVLAPESTGQTVNSQPSLYWAVSKVIEKPFKFTLVYADPIKHGTTPVLETNIDKPVDGIQGVNLAKHNVTLKPDVEYQWSVTIIMNPKQGELSNDIVSQGTIKWVKPSSEMSAQLAKANEQQLSFIYAKAGFWYDAIDSVSKLIDKEPKNRALYKQQRAALLDQVGLKEFAVLDLKS